MATLFIRVYEGAAEVAIGHIQYDTVAIGAGSVQSAVIVGDKKRHRRVRLFADADCFVADGDNPTATGDGASGMPLGAENPEYVWIYAGQKFAVIERV
jgi:hypothetical protein